MCVYVYVCVYVYICTYTCVRARCVDVFVSFSRPPQIADSDVAAGRAREAAGLPFQETSRALERDHMQIAGRLA